MKKASRTERSYLKKLAIVGTGSETREQAPFDDLSFDIWVFNEAANSGWCKRWDACFQMHEPEIYKGHNTKDPHHWKWLQERHGKPIYMQEIDPLVPDSVQYPLQEATDLIGFTFLSSTLSMACALAVIQRYDVVHFYGIELSMSEYEAQAKGYAFWVGFLKGRLGAENVTHNFTNLDKNIFHAPLYGYEGAFAFGVEYFAERAQLLEANWRASTKHIHNVKRAITRAVEDREFEKLLGLAADYQAAAIQCGEYSGALSEAERYQTFGSRYADRGGFEFAAAKAQRDGDLKKFLMIRWDGKIEYVLNVWKQNGSEQAKAQLLAFMGTMGGVAEAMGALLGVYKENLSYIVKYDETVQAGGRVLLEAAQPG